MWILSGTRKNYNLINAQKWLNQMYPAEVHGLGGDCINPKCDYEFTAQDEAVMAQDSGWFTCPQCDQTYNYLDTEVRHNKVGMTPMEMGNIGEKIVEQMGTIPLLGPITWVSNEYTSPLDMIAGPYGVEIKTNHSEAQPRFKLGGGAYSKYLNKNPLKEKTEYCFQNGLQPALLGVRLNFYYDTADIFVRLNSFTDTWISNAELEHVATLDFSDLNPYKRPEDVPPPSEMPEDDSDIPF